jgi:phenylpyruvate tautomerase
MPFLSIQTNQAIEEGAKKPLLAKASKLVSEQLGKSERYVMAALAPNPDMIFAGENEPLAYLELKSIGLPENSTSELAQALCDLVASELGIKKDRIYIEFSNTARHMWGWNGGTF